MRSLVKKHRRLLIGMGIFVILFLTCYSTALILNNYSQINKTLWRWTKPEKYYMKIQYVQECYRTWESVWEDDKLVSIISDNIEMRDQCVETDLDITKWSMDYVFDVIVENCGKGTVFCNVDYDPRFHYPSKVNSLYQYSFEVQNFVVCDVNKSNCP